MNKKVLGFIVLVFALAAIGIVWAHQSRDGKVAARVTSSEEKHSQVDTSDQGEVASESAANPASQTQSLSVRHPFPEVPRTRDGMSFENDPGYAESKAEQRWLDRHGFPNEKQLEAYMVAPEALLKQASAAGDKVAQTILDARLLPTDPLAQQRLVEAGAEGDLFALNMLASYQGGSPNGDPVAAYAVSRVAEMRGDARAAITRDLMISMPLTTDQRMLAEAEALRLNETINQMYRAKHGTAPVLDKRPIVGQ